MTPRFLGFVEKLCDSLQIKSQNRSYRKTFSNAYKVLYKEGKLMSHQRAKLYLQYVREEENSKFSNKYQKAVEKVRWSCIVARRGSVIDTEMA